MRVTHNHPQLHAPETVWVTSFWGVVAPAIGCAGRLAKLEASRHVAPLLLVSTLCTAALAIHRARSLHWWAHYAPLTHEESQLIENRRDFDHAHRTRHAAALFERFASRLDRTRAIHAMVRFREYAYALWCALLLTPHLMGVFTAVIIVGTRTWHHVLQFSTTLGMALVMVFCENCAAHVWLLHGPHTSVYQVVKSCPETRARLLKILELVENP